MSDFNVAFDYTKSKIPCSENHTDYFVSEQDILERPYRMYAKAFILIDPKYKSFTNLHTKNRDVIPRYPCDLYRTIWRNIFYSMIDSLHDNKEYHIGARIKVSLNPGSSMGKLDNFGLFTNFSRNYPSLDTKDVGNEPWGIFFTPINRIGHKSRVSHRLLLPTSMRGQFDDRLINVANEVYPPQISSLGDLIKKEVAKYPWFNQVRLRASMRASFLKFSKYIYLGAQIGLYADLSKVGIGALYKPYYRSHLYYNIMNNCKVEWRLNYLTHIDKERHHFYLGLRADLYKKYRDGEILTTNLSLAKAQDYHWTLYRSKHYCKELYPYVFRVSVDKNFFPHIDVKKRGYYDHKFTFIGRYQDFKLFTKVGTRFRYNEADRIRYKNEKKSTFNLQQRSKY